MGKLTNIFVWVGVGTMIAASASMIAIPYVFEKDNIEEIPNTNEKAFLNADIVSLSSRNVSANITIKQPNSRWMIKEISFSIVNKKSKEVVFVKEQIKLPEIPDYERTIVLDTSSKEESGSMAYLESSTEYSINASYTFHDESKPIVTNEVINGGSFKTLAKTSVSLVGNVNTKESFDSLGLDFEIDNVNEERYKPNKFKVEIFYNENGNLIFEKSEIFSVGLNETQFNFDINNLKPNKRDSKFYISYSNKDLGTDYEYLTEGDFDTLIVPYAEVNVLTDTASATSRDFSTDIEITKYREEDQTTNHEEDIEKIDFYIREAGQSNNKWEIIDFLVPDDGNDYIYTLNTSPKEEYIRKLDADTQYELYTSYTKYSGETVNDQLLYDFSTNSKEEPVFNTNSLDSMKSWNQFKISFEVDEPNDEFYSVKDDKLFVKVWDNPSNSGTPIEDTISADGNGLYSYTTPNDKLKPNTNYWWEVYYDDLGDDLSSPKLLNKGEVQTRIANKGKVTIDSSSVIADERNVEFALDIAKPVNDGLTPVNSGINRTSDRELWVKNIAVAISEDGDDPNKGKDHRVWLKQTAYQDIYEKFGKDTTRLLGFTRGGGETEDTKPGDGGRWYLNANTDYKLWVKTEWEDNSIATEDDKKFIEQVSFRTKEVEPAKINYNGITKKTRNTADFDIEVLPSNYVTNKKSSTNSSSESMDNIANTEVYTPRLTDEYFAFDNPYSIKQINLKVREQGKDDVLWSKSKEIGTINPGGNSISNSFKIDNIGLNKNYDIYLQTEYRDNTLIPPNLLDEQIIDTFLIEEKEFLDPALVSINESEIKQSLKSAKFTVDVSGPVEKTFGSAVNNISVQVKDDSGSVVFEEENRKVKQPGEDLALNEKLQFDTGDKLINGKKYDIFIKTEYNDSSRYPTTEYIEKASFISTVPGNVSIESNDINSYGNKAYFGVTITKPTNNSDNATIKQISVELRDKADGGKVVWSEENRVVPQSSNFDSDQIIRFDSEEILENLKDYEIWVKTEYKDSTSYPTIDYVKKAEFKNYSDYLKPISIKKDPTPHVNPNVNYVLKIFGPHESTRGNLNTMNSDAAKIKTLVVDIYYNGKLKDKKTYTDIDLKPGEEMIIDGWLYTHETNDWWITGINYRITYADGHKSTIAAFRGKWSGIPSI